MNYREIIKISEDRAAVFRTRRDESGYLHEENCQRALWELLDRVKAAEKERDEAVHNRMMMEQKIGDLITREHSRYETIQKMVTAYQDTIVPGYRKIADNAAEVASNICDDFIDFVIGGVYNAAPYCDNRRPECVNAHGLCNGDNKVCRGFFPKAAISRKE